MHNLDDSFSRIISKSGIVRAAPFSLLWIILKINRNLQVQIEINKLQEPIMVIFRLLVNQVYINALRTIGSYSHILYMLYTLSTYTRIHTSSFSYSYTHTPYLYVSFFISFFFLYISHTSTSYTLTSYTYISFHTSWTSSCISSYLYIHYIHWFSYS